MSPLYSSNHLLLPAVYRGLTDISAVPEFPVSDMARSQELKSRWWCGVVVGGNVAGAAGMEVRGDHNVKHVRGPDL